MCELKYMSREWRGTVNVMQISFLVNGATGLIAKMFRASKISCDGQRRMLSKLSDRLIHCSIVVSCFVKLKA